MDFRHGIGHHHHHHSPSEDEQQPPIYPPPGFRPSSPPRHPHHHQRPYPPPSHVAHEHHGPHPQPFPSIVQHVAHEHHGPHPQPFPSSVHHMDHEHHGPHPQPFPSSVQHVAHEHHGPHPQPFPSSVQHVAHETHFPHPPPHHDRSVPVHHLPQGQHVRVFCEAETEYSLSIRHGSVVLAPRNASDQFQQWIKDEKYSTKVKDKEGFPSFALVNKETGLALQHSIGATQPVRLTPYRPDEFDQSILWTLSKDMGHGFRAVRMVNNIHLNLDAFHGDKYSGGVHDGTVIVVWEWNKGDNQRWKLAPY